MTMGEYGSCCYVLLGLVDVSLAVLPKCCAPCAALRLRRYAHLAKSMKAGLNL